MAQYAPLPTTHPLVTELSALRQQLAQYQRAAHQASIQVQGTRLELELCKEETEGLKYLVEALKMELEVLRVTPEPPIVSSSSNALTELTLAHRRLSSKLDLTEQTLNITQLDLATAKQKLAILDKERDEDRLRIDALRRRDAERAEQLAWERGERRKLEEQMKLCDLALQEYSTLVKSLDPSAVPPPIPKTTSSEFFANLGYQSGSSTSSLTPSLDASASTLSSNTSTGDGTSNTVSSGETISNLLLGQRGVHQLFNDFTTTLATRERDCHRLEARVDELENHILILKDELLIETELRVKAQAEIDRSRREDSSAAVIVERYMTFSQKSHQNVHMHLTQLRARSAATQASLRKEVQALGEKLRNEVDRGRKVREAINELSAELNAEVAGRRREVGLRLKMIALEEKRERTIEKWIDRVRRAKEIKKIDAKGNGGEELCAEGIVNDLETNGTSSVSFEALLNEGVQILTNTKMNSTLSSYTTTKQGWRRLLSRNTGETTPSAENNNDLAEKAAVAERESSSLARILLMEELVTTLVQDLQMETERRIDLEKQRVEYLARDAEKGIGVGGSGGHLMFDAEAEGDANGLRSVSPSPSPSPSPASVIPAQDDPIGISSSVGGLDATSTQTSDPEAEVPSTSLLSSSASTSPEMEALRALFSPLTDRFIPLQKTLHDQSIALSQLRPASADKSLSTTTVNPPSVTMPRSVFAPLAANKRSGFPFLSLKSGPSNVSKVAEEQLASLLDGLHEVIEDARVDVEIALADEERVFHGFETLVGVGVGLTPTTSAMRSTAKPQIHITSPSIDQITTMSNDQVLRDAREYVEERMVGPVYLRLARRMEDIDHDLALIKRTIHEMEGMDDGAAVVGGIEGELQPPVDIPTSTATSIWSTLPLRTVSPIAPKPSPSLYGTLSSDSLDTDPNFGGRVSPFNQSGSRGMSPGVGASPSTPNGGVRPRTTSGAASLLGSMGRTLSSGVIGAPRRVSGMTGMLYRSGSRVGGIAGVEKGSEGRNENVGEEDKGLLSEVGERLEGVDDDVE